MARYRVAEEGELEHSCCHEAGIMDTESKEKYLNKDGSFLIAEFRDRSMAERVVGMLNEVG